MPIRMIISRFPFKTIWTAPQFHDPQLLPGRAHRISPTSRVASVTTDRMPLNRTALANLFAVAGVITGIVGGMAGCQSSPSIEPTQIPALIKSNDVSAIGYNIQWITSLGLPASQKLAWTIILDDLIISAETPDNVITAISLRNGQVRWRQLVGVPGDRLYRPVRLNETLLINTGTTFYAIHTDSGHIEYAHELNQVVQSSPVLIDNNTLVFGAMTGRVYGLGVNSGFQSWAYQMSAGITADPIAIDERVFVADQNGIYAMFDGGQGQLLWKGRAFERVVANPVADRNTVYMASEDRSLYALDARSGRDKWVYRTTTPLTDSAIVLDPDNETIYLPIPFQALVAINTTNGRERWRLPAAVCPVTYHDQRIVAYDKNNIHIIDTESGKNIRTIPTHNVSEILPGANHDLIVISDAGQMMMLSPNR